MENKKLEEFTEDEDILMSILDGEETEITLKSINPLEKMDIYQMQYIEDKHWYFRYKNKVLKGLLEKYIVGENLDILDIGVGTGTISKELDKLGKTIHIDNSDSIISFNKKVNPEQYKNICMDANDFQILKWEGIMSKHRKNTYSS